LHICSEETYYNEESDKDNFISNTLKQAVCEYLSRGTCSITIKLCVLGKLGVGKTDLISNYISAKREQLYKDNQGNNSDSSPGLR
jgi:GTPase SAR1 family protein